MLNNATATSAKVVIAIAHIMTTTTASAISATATTWHVAATVSLLLFQLVELVGHFLVCIFKNFDQIVDTLRVFLRDQTIGSAGIIGASRSPNAVDIILDRVRKVVVDDISNRVNV